MNYIVDPSWVYWMNIANAAKLMCLIVGGGCLIVSLIVIPVSIAEAFDDDDDYKTIRKWAVPVISIGVFLVLAGVFIPSKQTLITMKVAEMATKENVTLTAQQLKEIVDYIINALKELK